MIDDDDGATHLLRARKHSDQNVPKDSGFQSLEVLDIWKLTPSPALMPSISGFSLYWAEIQARIYVQLHQSSVLNISKTPYIISE